MKKKFKKDRDYYDDYDYDDFKKKSKPKNGNRMSEKRMHSALLTHDIEKLLEEVR